MFPCCGKDSFRATETQANETLTFQAAALLLCQKKPGVHGWTAVGRKRAGAKERERERQKDRETERQRDRETERQRDRDGQGQ